MIEFERALMENPRNAHFVPAAYLKAWYTKINLHENENKNDRRVFLFDKNKKYIDERNIKSIFHKKHYYKVNLKQHFDSKSDLLHDDLAMQILSRMENNKPRPVYAKYKDEIIDSIESIKKHMFTRRKLKPEEEKKAEKEWGWKFFYCDTNCEAKSRAINSDIDKINNYSVEKELNKQYEDVWEDNYKRLIGAVQNKLCVDTVCDREVPQDCVEKAWRFFCMMLFRNPKFDAFGTKLGLKENILNQNDENYDDVENLMEAYRLNDMVGVISKNPNSIFEMFYSTGIRKCQLYLIHAPDDIPFITSDNPAFKFSHPDRGIECYLFPMTPQYLLWIEGSMGKLFNTIGYRRVNHEFVKFLNNAILDNCAEAFISNQPTLDNLF